MLNYSLSLISLISRAQLALLVCGYYYRTFLSFHEFPTFLFSLWLGFLLTRSMFLFTHSISVKFVRQVSLTLHNLQLTCCMNLL